jgi:hypothetical protein
MLPPLLFFMVRSPAVRRVDSTLPRPTGRILDRAGGRGPWTPPETGPEKILNG